MSRCARTAREHSQAASPDWPMEIFLTIYTMLSLWMGVGWRAGIVSFFPWIWSLLWVQTFSGVPRNPWVLRSLLWDWLRTGQWAVRKKFYCVSCFAYSLLYECYYFLCCFTKLSLSQPVSFPFCPFLLPIPLRGEGWASGCLVLSCHLSG